MKSLKENPFIKQDRLADDDSVNNSVQKAVLCRRQQATMLSANPFIQRDRSITHESEAPTANTSRLPVRRLSIIQPQNPFVSGHSNCRKQETLEPRRRSINTALYANTFIMAD